LRKRAKDNAVLKGKCGSVKGVQRFGFILLIPNRPAWDSVVIVLSLGGTALSAIGLFMGLKRLRRGVRRTAKAM